MDSIIKLKRFSEIDLNDPFFDSLKEDYQGFVNWFNKKSEKGEKAYVLEDNGIQAFLYLKIEKEKDDQIKPPLESGTRVKIGTMKVNPHGTRLGERFIKKAFDYALSNNIPELYVTVFPKHVALINLYKRYGFKLHGKKITSDGEEFVFKKSFLEKQNDVLLDYPVVNHLGRKKYLLGIYPVFHTKLFPDSKLHNESFDMIEDVSHTNSIHKIYVCRMKDVSKLDKGDVLVIYRTSDGRGPAYYRSVATSVCVVEEIRDIRQFSNLKDYLKYCEPYSVFDTNDLRRFYYNKKYKYIIKMTYNIALRKRLNRKTLIEEVGLNRSEYWGFIKLNDDHFEKILKLGGIYESLAINQTRVREKNL
ncbi:N-acetyltransferase [Polycladomyces sp. WAk]|uniref:N-acetyltransferase n=1 Tax=Polycladomyces zharkentensis TaxID=2807616 RepID=A0ABS2WI41_9BACL|nr:N-acetyltransferase [Polycladomyces sp. WAk]MBN2909143.1 N-acetyltransferase [Polycladomyces sp. WAk]